jgi:hypothetical protein
VCLAKPQILRQNALLMGQFIAKGGDDQNVVRCDHGRAVYD